SRPADRLRRRTGLCGTGGGAALTRTDAPRTEPSRPGRPTPTAPRGPEGPGTRAGGRPHGAATHARGRQRVQYHAGSVHSPRGAVAESCRIRRHWFCPTITTA